jgi:hypothetical protein
METRTVSDNENLMLRERLRKCLNKVPEAVNAGSYQKAVRFKAWAREATATMSKQTVSNMKLRNLCIEYEGFERTT